MPQEHVLGKYSHRTEYWDNVEAQERYSDPFNCFYAQRLMKEYIIKLKKSKAKLYAEFSKTENPQLEIF